MKRKLSYLLICALTLGLLAGCGAPADAETEQQPVDEPTTTTTEQMAQDTVTLDGLTDLLGKTDAELTETLGEGTDALWRTQLALQNAWSISFYPIIRL